MKKNKQKAAINKKVFIIITFILILFLILFFIFNKSGKNNGENLYDKTSNAELSPKFKTHQSDDLKIKLVYPSNFFVKDLGYRILITNYELIKNVNYRPNQDEIEIQISIHNNCKIPLDEEMKIGNCFADGNWIQNEIINKQVKALSQGTLFIYTLKQPSSSQRNRYIFQSDEKMIEISKSPDPSQFEKEFIEIINSIKFL